MNIMICDSCKKEGVFVKLKIMYGSGSDVEYDLCDECLLKIASAIKLPRCDFA